MNTYKVHISHRRTIDLDVDADSVDEAVELASLRSEEIPYEKWDIADCEEFDVLSCNPMTKYKVYDLNRIFESSPDILMLETNSLSEVREFTLKMLEEYFETRSKYGDPIYSILSYVNDEKIEEILKDYNYVITKEADGIPESLIVSKEEIKGYMANCDLGEAAVEYLTDYYEFLVVAVDMDDLGDYVYLQNISFAKEEE